MHKRILNLGSSLSLRFVGEAARPPDARRAVVVGRAQLLRVHVARAGAAAAAVPADDAGGTSRAHAVRPTARADVPAVRAAVPAVPSVPAVTRQALLIVFCLFYELDWKLFCYYGLLFWVSTPSFDP